MKRTANLTALELTLGFARPLQGVVGKDSRIGAEPPVNPDYS